MKKKKNGNKKKGRKNLQKFVYKNSKSTCVDIANIDKDCIIKTRPLDR